MRAWGSILVWTVCGCDIVFSLDRPKPPPGVWDKVAAGAAHTCAIKIDGTLWCWGDNRFGAAGVVEGVPYLATPTQIGGASWTQISTRGTTTCGIQSDGTMWCWGYNGSGQAGVGLPETDVYLPQPVTGGPWIRVDVGIDHSCAIDRDHALWCWGDGYGGRLGTGSSSSEGSPVRVEGSGWTDVSVGSEHACALKGTAVSCWGSNVYGQLADPTVGDRTTPNAAPGEWRQIAAGDGFTCLLDVDDDITCFGRNSDGQLGDGSTRNNRIGTALGRAGTWTAIAAGRDHVCALDDGALWCWGENRHGEVPTDENGAVASLPRQYIDVDLVWTKLALGAQHTCAIDDDHRLYCVGADAHDELGQGTSSATRGEPAEVAGSWTEVALGTGFTCAVSTEGEVGCWGRNDQYQLGDGTGQPRQTPGIVSRIGEAIVDLVAGTYTACARGTSGGVRYCWGANQFAELGDTSSLATSPAEVPRKIADTWFPVAMDEHACGFDDDRNAGCWGSNYFGAVGVGQFGNYVDAPTLVSGGAPFVKLYVGWQRSCGLSEAGAMWCWGYNDYGQVGDNTLAPRSSPVPVIGATAITEAALGDSHTCAIGAGGRAMCWGLGSSGQLGLGGTTTYGLPQLIPNTWRQLAAGELHTCGIASDQTLWCWGSNTLGQLGDGTYMNQLSPTQIGTRSDWTRVVAGRTHTCGFAGATLYCWGENSDGELGNSLAWRTELVRIPD